MNIAVVDRRRSFLPTFNLVLASSAVVLAVIAIAADDVGQATPTSRFTRSLCSLWHQANWTEPQRIHSAPPMLVSRAASSCTRGAECGNFGIGSQTNGG